MQKLVRGSKVDTLELLQYLHRHLKREAGGLLGAWLLGSRPQRCQRRRAI